MKKLLFLLLLITSVSYGQAIAPTRVKITNNAISTTAPFVNVQETDGFVNKINKSDLIEVLEYASAINLPVTGVAGKIYVTLDNNRLYRWTGTIYQDLGYVDISNKVDKVTGKSLLSDAEITRLATLANYTHPANHPPSIITQDGSNRFVTDAEKSAWNAKQNALGFTAENSANKNNANGYAGLDSAGKVPLSQINDALLGSVNFKGTFNAATNVPAIPTATSSNKGWYYTVSNAGSQQGLNLVNGDWIISNGVVWAKVDNNNSVTSVAGKVGSVSLVKADVGLSNVDNTSDLLKPISTAAATAIASKATTTGTTGNIQRIVGTNQLGNSALTDNGTSVTSNLPISVTGSITGTTIVKSGAPATDALLAGGTTLANPISGTGASGQVSFWNDANSQTGDNSLFWDNANKRLGIGTATPAFMLSGEGASAVASFKRNATPITTSAKFLFTRTGSTLTTDITAGMQLGSIQFRALVGGSEVDYSALSYFANSTTVGDGSYKFLKSNLISPVLQVNTETGVTIIQNGGAFTDNLQGALQVTGNITASPATLPNQVIVKSQLDAALRPYKFYTALLTQTGTNAPVATVLENTLGINITFTRSSTGFYLTNTDNLFNEQSKMVFFATPSASNSGVGIGISKAVDVARIEIRTTDSVGSISDSAMSSPTSIEIRVYNFMLLFFPYSMIRRRKRKIKQLN